MSETVRESGEDVRTSEEGLAEGRPEGVEDTEDMEGPDVPKSDGGNSDDANSDDESPSNTEALLVREGDVAGDYLERLLDLLDYDGDIDLDVEAGRAIARRERSTSRYCRFCSIDLHDLARLFDVDIDLSSAIHCAEFRTRPDRK